MNEINKMPTICLNMIVKNESHIIEDSLNKLCDKIKFDYWVIVDTGSKDNTPEIIENFFKIRNIPGELKYEEWKNFGYNRTIALNHAYNKTDLLLIFDADDELSGDFPVPTRITHDKYMIKFGNTTTYYRCCLINNRKKFKYVGVLHEYIECIEKSSTTTSIEGEYYFISGRTSFRNSDPQKYLNDAIMLEKGYLEAKQSNDSIYNRYSFYCANSYNDYGDVENSIKWYKNTLTLDGWKQEKYISCLKLFEIFDKKQSIENALYYALKSYYYDKERCECIYELIKYYTIEGMPLIANNYYLLIKEYYENKYLNDTLSDKLFVNKNIYEFYLPYFMIIVSENNKDYNTGIKMYEILFNKNCNTITQWHLNNLIYNLQFFINKLTNNKEVFLLQLENYITQFYEKGNFEFQIKLLLNYANYGLNINNLNAIPEPIRYIYYNKEKYYKGFANNELKPGIPKVVYYTFKNDNLPENIKEIISNNKKLCPNYEFKFYNDDDCDLFIKTNFPEIVYNAYRKINPIYGAFKADFFRYCILYINGGIYIDIKSSFTKNLDDVINNNDMCLLDFEGRFVEKWRNVNKAREQSVLIYAPKHPYLKTMINVLVHSILSEYVPKKINQYNIPEDYTKIKILNISGPDAYANVIKLAISIYNLDNNLHREIIYHDFSMWKTCDYLNMYSMNNIKHYSQYNEKFYI
jgi:mannosyltransferase OCH1-like enzyme